MTPFLPALRSSIAALLGPEYPISFDVPPRSTAWLAVPVFAAAKQRGLNPADHALDVAAKLKALSNIVVRAEGGFVNIEPTSAVLAGIVEEAAAPRYGSSRIGEGQTIVVEFSGPNIAKPMGVGHLRSTIIGDTLRRLYAELGYTVVAVNHLGDWGTQFGNLAVAYQQAYGDLAIRDDVTVERLLELYVGFHAALPGNPTLKAEGQAMFHRLEKGDEAVRALWQHFVQVSRGQFEQLYERLGVAFDDPGAGESRYQPLVPALIERAVQQGVAVESEGALVIPIADESVPLILQKSDGSTIYAARDLAAIEYRVEHYHPQEIIYVVANEQALHFRQVFAAARLLGLVAPSIALTHVKFGLVRTETGKMSTRQGTTVGLEELLTEAARRSGAIVRETDALTDEERTRTVEALAIGALKYFDLSHDRNHDIVFDWERMLSLKGDSAPYLQYSYVRAMNIVRKVGAVADAAVGDCTPYVALLRSFALFPGVVEQATLRQSPHLLAQYLAQLASHFHLFYEQYPVMNAVAADRTTRLAIVRSFTNVMKRGLSLLGIQTVDAM